MPRKTITPDEITQAVNELINQRPEAKPQPGKTYCITGLDELRYRALWAVNQILDENTGYDTPVPEFFEALIELLQWHRAVTPKDVRKVFETFERHFEDAVQTTRRFLRDYPQEVLGVDKEEAEHA